MTVGAGVCSQFGFKAESTVGTAVTVDTFHKHVSIGGAGIEPVRVIDEGLGGCFDMPTYDRTVEVATQVTREVELNPTAKKLGQLLKVMLGSSAAATQIGATAIYRQIHQNGDGAGKSLTVQFGFPQATAAGTIRPHTLRGCKVTQWELAQALNEILKLRLTLDAWAEATGTALATASYATSAETFNFKQMSCKLGGTPSLGSGLVSVAGGTEVTNCKGFSVRGNNNLRTDGYFSGASGIKAEQIQAGFKEITGQIEAEFADRAQLYDIFAAYTTTAVETVWTGTDSDGGSNVRLSVICPYTKLTSPGGNPQVSGPGTLMGPVGFRAFADAAGTLPAIQITYDSRDTAL